MTTDDPYVIYRPEIRSAVLTPNPAGINTSVRVSVSAEDVRVVLEPVWFYSGELYSGEV